MQKLKEAGLRVPQDIAIVGFNNDLVSRIVEPAITTVNYTGQDIGEIAAKNLISQLDGQSPADTHYTITLQSELIIRPSSLRIP